LNYDLTNKSIRFYAYIGHPGLCPNGCAAQHPGPNGIGNADAAVNITYSPTFLFEKVTTN